MFGKTQGFCKKKLKEFTKNSIFRKIFLVNMPDKVRNEKPELNTYPSILSSLGQEVSRKHAELRRYVSNYDQNIYWNIVDLNSLGGTYVNGVRIPSEKEIRKCCKCSFCRSRKIVKFIFILVEEQQI